MSRDREGAGIPNAPLPRGRGSFTDPIFYIKRMS